MIKPSYKVMLIGYFGPGALECSYESAFRDLGCTVSCFDIAEAVQLNCRGGKIGRLFNQFVPVEPWIRKANREMVLAVLLFKPDIVVVFGQNPVQVGALAQLKTMTDLKVVYIWPDTLLNLSHTMIDALPMYDLVATYSGSTVTIFQQLGARRVEWVPLGADPHMHTPINVTTGFECDVSFIGQWRPEREAVMVSILSTLTDINVKIWGPDWKRRSSNPAVLKAWQGRPLYAQEFASTITASKINLNIIDDTNYPSANMRFFEIICAGGLQVCSPCPEMEDKFKHGETIFYYHTPEELIKTIKILLGDAPLRHQVAVNAHIEIINGHTYKHRASQILSLLK